MEVPVPLQVKDSDKIATHETAEECGKMFKKILQAALALKEKHPIWCDEELYISHDQATFFVRAEKPEGDGEVYHLITMPPHSPDLHKIVEHDIGYIKRIFRKEFTQLKGKVAHQRAMDLMEELLREAITQESIMKDVNTLFRTIDSVIRNGGDWAEIPLR